MRLVVLGLLAIGLLACRPLSREQRFAYWLSQGHETEVAAYQGYLSRHGLDQVLPMPQLLRSARRWRRCGAEEFAVPPKPQWPAMRTTLELVRELEHAGFLDRSTVASAYRDDALNRCEGGSSRSRHRINNALDFDLAANSQGFARLCAYWRAYGAAHAFGLGFYSERKIHVDTSGFRTWGSDFTRRSSLCAANKTTSR